MDSAAWEQLEEIFFAALDHKPEGRQAYLDQACAGQEDLRLEINAMLTAHEDARGLAIESQLLRTATDEEESLVGSRIGAYHLERLLGRGGMGEVYLGQRADAQYRQEVAIKVVRPGLQAAEILTRFSGRAADFGPPGSLPRSNTRLRVVTRAMW